MCPSSERLPVKISDRRWGGLRARTPSCCNQQTTPQASQPVFSADVITVTDPRHPLCGRTMPLLATHERPGQTWFEVEQAPGIRRWLPVGVTDQSSLAQPHASCPLDWHSVRQLLAHYTAIIAGPEEDAADGCPDERGEDGTAAGAIESDGTGRSVGEYDGGATGTRASDRGAGLPGAAGRGAVR